MRRVLIWLNVYGRCEKILRIGNFENLSFFWVVHFEFLFQKKKILFCFIPMKISPNWMGQMFSLVSRKFLAMHNITLYSVGPFSQRVLGKNQDPVPRRYWLKDKLPPPQHSNFNKGPSLYYISNFGYLLGHQNELT